MRRVLLVVVATLMASACVSVLPEPGPAPTIYGLRAGMVERASGEPKDVVLAVAVPSAPRSAAGADIVWRRDREIAFMDRAAWDGAAPDLLQALLVDTMDRRGGVRAVVRGGAGVRAEAEVRWDVLAFEVVEGDGPLEARIEIAAQLVDLRSRALLQAGRFTARAPISARSGRAAAAALERAASDASLQIADWAIRHAGADQPSAASTSR